MTGAERVQIELLRQAGMSRRLEIMGDLSRTVLDLSRAALRRRHPEWSEVRVRIELAALCYGKELGEKLEKRLESEG